MNDQGITLDIGRPPGITDAEFEAQWLADRKKRDAVAITLAAEYSTDILLYAATFGIAYEGASCSVAPGSRVAVVAQECSPTWSIRRFLLLESGLLAAKLSRNPELLARVRALVDGVEG